MINLKCPSKTRSGTVRLTAELEEKTIDQIGFVNGQENQRLFCQCAHCV